MADWVADLTSSTNAILDTVWDVRDGTVVPETTAVALKDGAVKLEATFLYADLAGSSRLAELCPWDTTAKIIRSYLDISTRLIRAWRGEIRSFDGDRVMAVFKGATKEADAANCAREIDWCVHSILSVQATKKFASVQKNAIEFRHAVGVSTGVARAVRAGIRNNNDLIWIGRPPSYAAKLSDIRKYPWEVYICSTTYSRLTDATKMQDGVNVWSSDTFKFAGGIYKVYACQTPRKP